MFYWIIKFIFGPIFRLIWVENVEGLENIPLPLIGGVIIASNHESYFDFLLMPAICKRRLYYIAAEKFFDHPLWSILMKLTSQIYVDRYRQDKTDMYKRAFKVLKKGDAIVIFPEGTRSGDGKLQKAYVGAVRIALTAKVPIVPVGIIGTYEILSRNSRYPRFTKCKIKFGKPIFLKDYFGQEDNEQLLRSITDKILMQKIAGLTGEEYKYHN